MFSHALPPFGPSIQPRRHERAAHAVSLERMLAFEPLAPRAQAIAHRQDVQDVIDELERVSYAAVHEAARGWLTESSSVTVLAKAAP